MLMRQSPSLRHALRQSRRAFTLLEVLVVVAIIVMLAGVGGYYLLQRYEEAKVSRAKTDVHELKNQLEQYKLKYNDYPASMEGLTQGVSGDAPMVRPDAIKDPWGKIYQFHRPDGASTFEAEVFTTTPKGITVSSNQESR